MKLSCDGAYLPVIREASCGGVDIRGHNGSFIRTYSRRFEALFEFRSIAMGYFICLEYNLW